MSHTMQMWTTHRDLCRKVEPCQVDRSTSRSVRLNAALGRPIQGRLLHSWLCRQNDGGIVECVRRSTFTWSTFWHIWPNRNSSLTLTPNPNPLLCVQCMGDIIADDSLHPLAQWQLNIRDGACRGENWWQMPYSSYITTRYIATLHVHDSLSWPVTWNIRYALTKWISLQQMSISLQRQPMGH